MDERVEGTVTRVFLTRGFGFVKADDTGLELFMHIENLLPNQVWEEMRAGQRVSFIVLETKRGYRAGSISLC